MRYSSGQRGQTVNLLRKLRRFESFSHHKKNVIRNYYDNDDLKKLSPEIRAKMWLIHYSDHKLPRAKTHGFAGFIKRGQTFDLSKKIRYLPN